MAKGSIWMENTKPGGASVPAGGIGNYGTLGMTRFGWLHDEHYYHRCDPVDFGEKLGRLDWREFPLMALLDDEKPPTGTMLLLELANANECCTIWTVAKVIGDANDLLEYADAWDSTWIQGDWTITTNRDCWEVPGERNPVRRWAVLGADLAAAREAHGDLVTQWDYTGD